MIFYKYMKRNKYIVMIIFILCIIVFKKDEKNKEIYK